MVAADVLVTYSIRHIGPSIVCENNVHIEVELLADRRDGFPHRYSNEFQFLHAW